MKLLIDDSFVNLELKDYLLSQKGITYVAIEENKFLSEIIINHNNKTTPLVIMMDIELFQNYNHSVLVEFDKEDNEECNTLKYVIEDMCCEYCYKGLVRELFNNKNIKSVKSNFDFKKPAFNIELIIEYTKDYSQDEIIKNIKYNI